MAVLLQVFSYLLVVLTFLPLVRDNYWIFRSLEYPRFQKLILVLLTLAGWISAWVAGLKTDFIAVGLLAVCCVYLAYNVFPYTIVASKEVKTIKEASKENAVGVFSANVYQDNRDYNKMLEQIRATDPDVILLLETDQKWQSAMRVLETTHPYTLAEPLDNTYGLLFYSRLPLEKASVKYLVKNDVPSVDAVIKLRSGIPIRLFGLHPEPPVPGESLKSDAKDKELMKVAFAVRDEKKPCVVFGDLNDVAWSHTTSLFRRVSQLLDVRCGRGFYSTFSAKSKIMRFPLDYIFCSHHFGLRHMRRLPYNGSDHFPIFTELVYQPQSAAQNAKTNRADQDDLQDAGEMASKRVS